jgi:hypothetical protein
LDWSQRWLAVTDDGTPDLAPRRLAFFARALLGIIAVDQWHGLEYWSAAPLFGLHVVLALGVSLVAALAWRPRTLRMAAAGAAILLAIDLVWAFPDHANHQYLTCLSATVVALFDPEAPQEAATALAGLRWLVAIGLAWAGLQKVLWGYYFDGTFLSFAIAQRDTFATAFQWILPQDELTRLVALPMRDGAGPFRAESVWLDGLGLLTWITEVGLAAGLLLRRWQALAAVGAMALIALIEVAAREFFFGLVMFDFLLLFLPVAALRVAGPAFAVAGAVLMASVLGLLPDWTFT